MLFRLLLYPNYRPQLNSYDYQFYDFPRQNKNPLENHYSITSVLVFITHKYTVNKVKKPEFLLLCDFNFIPLKIISNILRTIWCIYGLILFTIMCILWGPLFIILPPLFGEKGIKFLLWLTYDFGAWIFMTLTLIRVKHHGREKVDKQKNYVFIGNHQSNLDFIAHPYAFPVPVKVLVKKELTKIPVFGWVMKALCIAVERENRQSRKESMLALNQELQKGYSIFIYPEGTRNRSNQALLPFKDGAFRLAIDAELPISVCTTQIRKVSDYRRGLDLCPGILPVYWADPIETKGMTLEDIPELKKKVRDIMLGHLKEEIEHFNLEVT